MAKRVKPNAGPVTSARELVPQDNAADFQTVFRGDAALTMLALASSAIHRPGCRESYTRMLGEFVVKQYEGNCGRNG